MSIRASLAAGLRAFFITLYMLPPIFSQEVVRLLPALKSEPRSGSNARNPNVERASLADLNTAIGRYAIVPLSAAMLVVLNATQNKEFKPSKLSIKSYREEIMGSDLRGVNAMSLSDITGIPRPTVVRKLKWLIDNNFLTINDKKLISFDAKASAFTQTKEIQKQNFLSFINFIYRLFNQINFIYS